MSEKDTLSKKKKKKKKNTFKKLKMSYHKTYKNTLSKNIIKNLKKVPYQGA